MRSTHAPHDAAAILGRAGVPWWVAGGHAIDLFVGRATRPHDDLDVAVLRRDADAVVRALPGWSVHVGLGDGVVEERPLAGPVPHGVNALWCRPSPSEAWAFELLLSDVDGGDWVFKRDARVRLPLMRLGRRTDAGLPFLAPEVVLLHKAKALREVDEKDLRAALPRMDEAARRWLAHALAVAHPGHPWVERVRP